MIDKRYYEKLGGFAYLLGELRKKLGREQTDVLVNDAVTLCNELCGKYQGLSKKEKLHTERMIFPRAAIYLQMVKYIPQEESIGLMEESVRIGVEPDRKRLRAVTKLPFIRPLFFKIFRKMIGTMFNGDAGFKFAEIEADSRHYRVDVIGGRSRCGTCIGGAWCMEEADWWICDSSGTRLCCQCTFDETTGFYYVWNLCGYRSCVCIAFY